MTRISKTGKGYEGAFRVALKTIYTMEWHIYY